MIPFALSILSCWYACPHMILYVSALYSSEPGSNSDLTSYMLVTQFVICDDLNPIEEAAGVRRLMDEAGLTQEKAAERLGKSRPAVANLLRLLTLPDSVKALLAEGKLSAGHARALVTVDPRRQVQLANLTVQQGWSVRQLERICAQPVKEEVKKPRVSRDAQIGELESMARELFGTRVRLDGTTDSGKITLFYYNSDDLQRIWDVLEMAREK